LHTSGSLATAVRELSRYELDLVGVQEVRWYNRETQRAGDYTFFFGKGNENHKFGTGCSVEYILNISCNEVCCAESRLFNVLISGR